MCKLCESKCESKCCQKKYIRVGKSVDQNGFLTLSYGTNVIEWDTKIRGNGLEFDFDNNEFIVPKTGIYSFKTNLVISSASNNFGVGLIVRDQNNTIKSRHFTHQNNPPLNQIQNSSDSATFFLEKNDKVQVEIYFAGGITIKTNYVAFNFLSFLEIVQI